ncbi:DNA-(apurinic or apyrimidinic site) lyase [Mesobacillus persicus]|uniref:Formamidopyrimidine-DNA glycosylase n=1 Tax=Mesobacillus persicus TaxID=930146 RepID=A0A1H7XU97_9BACI|nr:DNA-formamidopyrimidine glycosylase [Mesobacillus persicus]SEM37234.1 DNA-(apurinic or apyrimidinic site) lyase [Mesobacillus persicus]
MPELPEVETVRKTLEALVIGKEIQDVAVHWPKMVKHPGELEQFTDALRGQRILDIGRRGKFLIFYTEDYALISHLRMEGKYGVFSADEPVDKHTHAIFKFTDGSEMRYKDVRKFGTFHLYKKGEEFKQAPLVGLGPEPFSDEFTLEGLKVNLRKTSRKVKPALLDQKVLVGLGNIYVDEALFRSKIHPERIASTLTDEEIELLHQEIVNTLSEAVKLGGSTIRSYINSQGQIGMFQLQLYAYGRQGEPCKNCGTEMEKTVVGGRGTHFCPKCQRKE